MSESRGTSNGTFGENGDTPAQTLMGGGEFRSGVFLMPGICHAEMSPSYISKFWARVEKRGEEDCWIWRGGLHGQYGTFRFDGTTSARAHRIAYWLIKGPIPYGFTIDHLCGNKPCVNPAHLEAVTHQENVRRGWAAARARGVRPRTAPRHPDGILIDRIGGSGVVRRRLGLTTSQVCNWRAHGIAKRWRPVVAQMAREKGIPVPPDFCEGGAA